MLEERGKVRGVFFFVSALSLAGVLPRLRLWSCSSRQASKRQLKWLEKSFVRLTESLKHGGLDTRGYVDHAVSQRVRVSKSKSESLFAQFFRLFTGNKEVLYWNSKPVTLRDYGLVFRRLGSHDRASASCGFLPVAALLSSGARLQFVEGLGHAHWAAA